MKIQILSAILLFTTSPLFAAVPGIYDMITSNPFVIEKEKVDAITAKYDIEVHQLLQELIPLAKSFARPPISQYQVGVAALGKSGTVYLGVNLEFSGLPLNESIHGEQFLVVNARAHGEEELVAIAVSAAPCGHCRQFLHEMGKSEKLLIITPYFSNKTLASLLPDAFGPQDLALPATLMQSPSELPAYEQKSPIAKKALEAAFASYSPYTESKSGVAIQTKDGTIFLGSYLENAAFNPSLSPLHSALVALVVGMKEYAEIQHVVLAEQKSSNISHEVSSEHLLRQIAPSAIFEVIKF